MQVPAVAEDSVPITDSIWPVTLQKFWKARYFPALDGLRAVCVFLVLFNHIHQPTPKWVLGFLGVDIFFALSGFLITTLLVREWETKSEVSLVSFYIRRFFRIVPIYLITIALYVPSVFASHDKLKQMQFKIALPYLLGFAREFGPPVPNNIFGHAWTLGIEEKFYIVWPVLLVALVPFKKQSKLILLALTIGVCLLPYPFGRSYGGLLFGAIAAIYFSKSSGQVINRTPVLLSGWAVTGLLAVGYVLTLLNHHDTLIFAFGAALAIAYLSLISGPVQKFLSHPTLVFIGRRSYAMYLVHVLVIDAVESVAPKFMPFNLLVDVILSFMFSLLVASLLHFVENFSIATGRKISAKYSKRSLATT